MGSTAAQPTVQYIYAQQPTTYQAPTYNYTQPAPIYVNNSNAVAVNAGSYGNSYAYTQPYQYQNYNYTQPTYTNYTSPVAYNYPTYTPNYSYSNYTAPRSYTYPSVALTQIPYTGFDFGSIGDSIYWAMLALFGIAAAYLVLYYTGANAVVRKVALSVDRVRGYRDIS